MRRTTLIFTAASLLAVLEPSLAAAQFGTQIAMAEVRPTQGLGACVVANERRDARLSDVLGTRVLDQETAKVELRRLQDVFSAEASARPEDVEAQYALAAVFGSRAEVEGGRTRVRAAQAMHEQAMHVLSLDPDHAGAHYLMGRLHAGVMRMDRITRFVATRLLGGGALSGASWAEARARLEAAVAEDPCVPDHHFELARLYAERGQPSMAINRLQYLEQLTPSTPFAETFDAGSALLEELRRRSSGSD